MNMRWKLHPSYWITELERMTLRLQCERFNKLVFSVKFQQRFFKQHVFLITVIPLSKKKKPTLIVYFTHTPPISP